MSKINSSSSSTFESNKSRCNRQDLVPVDTGLIRCVCPSTEDDGFTIQCERCLVWQHAYCVKITHASIPDHYLCDQCSNRKRPKLSKRIPISKKKLRKLDSEDDPSFNNKKKKHVKSRIISRYVHPIFREAKERWSQSTRWKQQQETNGPLLYDHGPFVTMDATTLLTKGVLIDTPVSNQGLFATRTIPSLRYLMEVTGDVLLKSEFKFDPINDFVILGTPLSHIMFYPTLDLCIDTRQFGNKARYIRRSCHPNAELRNVVLPRDDKTIHLGLFARHLIEKGQEVTINWCWQRGHIAWKENMNWHHQHKVRQGQDDEGHQVIDEEEERRRKETVRTMLDRFEKEFGACACVNKRRCLIEQLRRQIAPPKEKSVFKLPAVNMIPTTNAGRRKSSIILLKPKPQIEKKLDESSANQNSRQLIVSPTNSSTTKSKGGVEESLDIDVTSNSPTLGAVKDASDDELLDVDGDIDIGDDLPAPLDNMKDNLPLLDDNSSDDDDNADLSSLSSLSSLSVFEESGNDMTDDEENRSKSRRKKNSSRHGKSSRPHHNQPTSSSPAPVIEKVSPAAPSVLPRKKLWMRDYLNKHVSDQTIKSPDAQNQQQQQQLKTEETNHNNISLEEKKYTTTNTQSTTTITVKSLSDVNNSSAVTDLDTKNDSMEIDEAVTTEIPPAIVANESGNVKVEIETSATVIEDPAIKEGEKSISNISVMETADTFMAEVEDTTEKEAEVDVAKREMEVDVPEGESNVFDIDDGELSDASTILLDEDELRQVYRRRSVDQIPAVDDEVVTTVNEEGVSTVDREMVAVEDAVSAADNDTVDVSHEDIVIADKDEVADVCDEVETIDKETKSEIREEIVATDNKVDVTAREEIATIVNVEAKVDVDEKNESVVDDKVVTSRIDEKITPAVVVNITTADQQEGLFKDKTPVAAQVESLPQEPVSNNESSLHDPVTDKQQVDDTEKKPVKKISLKEYLSKQQQQKSINQ